MIKNMLGFMLVLYIVTVSGCQAIDRGYESVVSATDPDRVRLNTTLKWLKPQPRVGYDCPYGKTVYVRVKNSAGIDIDFAKVVQVEIMQQGYIITYDPSQASYILVADIRDLREKTIKHADGAVAGAVGGAVVGGVIGNNTNAGTGPGAVIGGIFGALLGSTADNRNKDREYIFTVDTSVGERMDVGVETTKTNNNITNLNSRAGATGESGSSHSSGSESQFYQAQEDFYFHTNRMIITARSLNLRLNDAAPILIRRASLAIASTLP
jgi:outer membrane lipoprotein SlyB